MDCRAGIRCRLCISWSESAAHYGLKPADASFFKTTTGSDGAVYLKNILSVRALVIKSHILIQTETITHVIGFLHKKL